MYPPFSLDQLTAFIAVVETGSFSAAGRRVGRVQSAVSYAIAQLEDAVGSTLFDRSGRTPVLTVDGRRLAAEARLVLAQARELSEVATRLRGGDEPVLRVAVDAIYPSDRLIDVCVAFADAFPATALRVEVGLLGDAVAVVREGRADLGACNLAGGAEWDLAVEHLGTVHVVPVCAPEHPLASQPPPHRESALRGAVQIVHSERDQQRTTDQGVLASRTWRVTEMRLKVELILRGVGWGSLPDSVAAPLLSDGRLVRLMPAPWPPDGHALLIHAVSRRAEPLGRAAQWFRDQLQL